MLFNITKRAFARESLSVTNGSAVALTAATYNQSATPTMLPRKASGARIAVKVADINFTEEGTTPVTGVSGTGTPAGDRDIIVLESYEAIVKFLAIAQGATATLEVVYYR